jgi:hypothetical protein
MGIQINGQTDTITAVDGGLIVSGADFTGVSAGTTAAPSISPSGDSNTGIFFPSADTIAFGEGGAESARFDSSGKLGIGTNNPTSTVDILGLQANTGATSASAPTGTLRLAFDGGQTNETYGSSLVFSQKWFSGTNAQVAVGQITGVKIASDGNFGGGLAFFTSNSSNNNLTERLRIDNGGRVTSPYQPAFYTVGTNYTQATGTSIIIPNTVSYNLGSHYNGTTGRFTAPIAGRYIFGFWGLSYPHNTEVNHIQGFVNGSGAGQLVQFNGTSTQHEECSGSLLLNLNANDVFDWRYARGSGTAAAYSAQWNMWGYLLG